MNVRTIRTGQIFDGEAVHGPTDVSVAGGKIVGIRPVGGTAPAMNGEGLVDLGYDAFLMPGLIDSHVHLCFDASDDPVGAVVATDDDELLLAMETAARRALMVGITTVRDLGDRRYLSMELAAQLRERPQDGPEILSAGPPITTPGGHCYFLGGETAGTEEDLRAAVSERYFHGAAVVKIMASGGNMTKGSVPHQSQFSRTELQVVVDEAHRLGLPVAAHVHGSAAIADAIAAGVDTIEHVTFLTADGAAPDARLLTAITVSGVRVSLTLGMAPGVDVDVPPAFRQQLETIRDSHRELIRQGAKIVAGSDAGIGPFKPHDVLPHAVSDLAGLGMSPQAALAAVTSEAAKACGVSPRKGRIAVGADADLLVLEGSPLDDLSALHAVRAVFRSGHRVR